MTTPDADLRRLNAIRDRWEHEHQISRASVLWLIEMAGRAIPPWAGIEPDPWVMESLKGKAR